MQAIAAHEGQSLLAASDLPDHSLSEWLNVATVKEIFSRRDTADYLETEEDIAAYLMACAAQDDPALFLAALGDVARTRNITQLAAKTGLTRMGLCKVLSGTGNPSFGTVSKVVHALGLRITVAVG